MDHERYDIEELEELDELFPYVSERRIRERIDHFTVFSDCEFIRRFRLSKGTVMLVLEKIQHLITPPSNRNNAVRPRIKFLLALRFYATGNMIMSVSDFSGISEASACTFIKDVSLAICSLRNEYITMPIGEDIPKMQLEFYKIARFPFVIGAIDCTHVRIQSPGGENAENFRNRKGYFSLNVQTISAPYLKIRNIVARWPGASHDLTIFNNSKVRCMFERGVFGSALLLGDSGYQNRPYLVTPLSNPRTAGESLFNESHIRTRNVVERQYGIWKRRFPVLRLEMRINIDRVQAVVVATAVLHNIAIDMGEEVPSDMVDENDEVVFVPPSDIGIDTRRAHLVDYFSKL